VIHEVITARITCDFCRDKSVDVTSATRTFRLPPGWTHVEEINCGLTDYTRTSLSCPFCARAGTPAIDVYLPRY